MMDETQKNEFEGKEEQKVSTEQKKEKKNWVLFRAAVQVSSA